MPLDGSAQRHTRRRATRCASAGVRAIVVLGGDGTHRVVAKACGDVPLCAISTGTNNAFPELRETTVAGHGGRRTWPPGARPRCGARAR